jgi:hypothetical protein
MDDQIRDVARSIRPYLPRLTGDRAAAYDQQLTELLCDTTSRADIDGAVLNLLASTPELHSWTAAMLEDERHRPPDLQPVAERGPLPEGGFSPLANPHGGDPVDAEKFVCPVDGNYAWWRISVAVPVPTCPDHPDKTLVLS